MRRYETAYIPDPSSSCGVSEVQIPLVSFNGDLLREDDYLDYLTELVEDQPEVTRVFSDELFNVHFEEVA